MIPIRIQFTLYDKLQAEVIVQSQDEADRVYAAFVNLKYAKRMEIGGALRQRADLPRYWDVPVGSTIPLIETKY